MKRQAFSGCMAACFIGLSSLTAHAGSFSVLGFGGLESLTPKDEDFAGPTKDKLALVGMGLGGIVQYQIFGLPLIGIIIGGGGKYSTIKVDTKTVDASFPSVTLSLSETQLALEAGANISIPMLAQFQATFGYDYGMSGELKASGSGFDFKTDIGDFSRITLNARAFLDTIPIIKPGIGASYYTGTFEPKKIAGFEPKAADFSGYALWGMIKADIPLL